MTVFDAGPEVPLPPVRRNVLRLRKGEQDCGGRARGSRKRQALPLRLTQDLPDEVFATSIVALPSDLLVHVFGHLDLKAHRFVLPLVCKQWCAPASVRHCGTFVLVAVYTLTWLSLRYAYIEFVLAE